MNAFGQLSHELGIAAAEDDIVDDERGTEAGDDVEDRKAPALFAAAFKPSKPDVFLIGTTVLVRQMREFERDDLAFEDEGRTKAGADAEEQHFPTRVAAKRLHGRVVDEADGLWEGGLISKANPARSKIVRFHQGAIMRDGSGIADGDRVVLPIRDGAEDIVDHLLRVHVWSGDDFQGNEIVARGDFDVGTANVDNKNFHVGGWMRDCGQEARKE